MALAMTPEDVGSIAFPFAHIGGPDYLVTCLASGFPVAADGGVRARRDAGALRPSWRDDGGAAAPRSTPRSSTSSASRPGSKVYPSLRLLSGGGAPKPPEIYYEVKRELGIPVAHGYGMTEVPMICQGSPLDTDDQLANTEGAPVHDAEVRIVLEDGSVAPPDVEGEVRVRGPMVFKGYTDPSLDAAAFDADGFFRTGDLGRARADGHITLTGRLKDVIIRKGENISAKEVEDLLYEHPQVGDVAVIGLPDPERGERVCAVVEVAAGAEQPTLGELADYLREVGLMVQKIPEQLEVVERLPRNATMKVLKYQLRDELRDEAVACERRHPGRDGRPAPRRPDRARDADAAQELEARLRRDVGVPRREGRRGRRAWRRDRDGSAGGGPGGGRRRRRSSIDEASLVPFSHWTPPHGRAAALPHLVLPGARCATRSTSSSTGGRSRITGGCRRRTPSPAGTWGNTSSRRRRGSRSVASRQPGTSTPRSPRRGRASRSASPRAWSSTARWCRACGRVTPATPTATATAPGSRHRLVMDPAGWRYLTTPV